MQTAPTLLESLLLRFHFLPTPILDAFGSVLYGRILCIAVRRGFFEALATGMLTPAELAGRTGLGRSSAGLMAEAFVLGGYLESAPGGFRLSREGRKWLLQSSPSYVGNLLAYMETLHHRWGDLEYALDRDRPHATYYEGFSDRDWQRYVLGMRDLARITLPHLRRHLRTTPRTRSVLDLGGSHGLYAAALCRQSPEIRATIVDLPGALRHAAPLLEEEGVRERCVLLDGDLRSMDLPKGQDIILIFNIIHGLTGEENAGLMQRALAALGTDGKLLILDQLSGQGGGSPMARMIPVLVGINLLSEAGGRSYTLDELAAWCGPGPRITARTLRLPGMTLVCVEKRDPR